MFLKVKIELRVQPVEHWSSFSIILVKVIVEMYCCYKLDCTEKSLNTKLTMKKSRFNVVFFKTFSTF